MFSIRTKLLAGVAATAATMAFPALAGAQDQKAASDSTKPDSIKEVFDIGKPVTPSSSGQGSQIQGGIGQGMVIQLAPQGGGGQGMVLQMMPQGGGQQGGAGGKVELRMQGIQSSTTPIKPDSAAAKTDSTVKADNTTKP